MNKNLVNIDQNNHANLHTKIYFYLRNPPASLKLIMTKFIQLIRLILIMVFIFGLYPVLAQNDKAENTLSAYPRNIILFIGDGMGITQLYSGLTINHGRLNLLTCKNIGLCKTNSATNYTTDSGAAATAIACGHKTYNGAMGLNTDSLPCKSIVEYAEEAGMATGVVATSAVTHATPAAFVSHQCSRYAYEAIAADFVTSGIDVFIGGGSQYFQHRGDGRNLLNDLETKGYKVALSADSLQIAKSGKLAALIAPDALPSILNGRGNMLLKATDVAIKTLEQNPNGFFLMVEGSQIDWGGHSNDALYVASEVIDLDSALGKALEFAADGQTLVIVTADHETGGMALLDGSFETGSINAVFAAQDHTGTLVPVFAWGPGEEQFRGFLENSDLFYKMMSLLRIPYPQGDKLTP
jgi:alkaline phosphatase